MRAIMHEPKMRVSAARNQAKVRVRVVCKITLPGSRTKSSYHSSLESLGSIWKAPIAPDSAKLSLKLNKNEKIFLNM